MAQLTRSDTQQFYIKEKVGIGRNDTTSTLLSICIVRRNIEHSTLSNAHLSNTFVPALDHLTYTDSKTKWISTITR